MIKRITLPFGILLLLTSAARAQAPVAVPAQGAAVNEAIYRQANLIRLHTTLDQARAAEARNDMFTAGQLYSAAWDLVVKIGLPPTAPETDQTRRGLAAADMELARRAQAKGDYREADRQVSEVLRVDPANTEALVFRQE